MSMWAKMVEHRAKGWRRVARSSGRARVYAFLIVALGLILSVWRTNENWLLLATPLAIGVLSASAPGEP